MNDCPNAMMREHLPELLHDRLDAGTRAAVMAHVSACADCRAELELLRGVRGMLVAKTPRVDVNFVVQALPKPPRPARSPVERVAPRQPARRVWSDWRVAAAVTLLVAGGSSVAIMHRGAAAPQVSDSVAVAHMAPPASAASRSVDTSINAPSTSSASVASNRPAPVQSRASAASAGAETVASTEDADVGAGFGAAGRLGDLNAKQLKALLDQIGDLQPVPVADPEPVTIRVNPNADSPNADSPEGSS